MRLILTCAFILLPGMALAADDYDPKEPNWSHADNNWPPPQRDEYSQPGDVYRSPDRSQTCVRIVDGTVECN